MDGWSRRALLRRGLATALAAGTAGCSYLPPASATPAPTGTFLDWLPAPDEVTGQGYVVRTQSRAGVRDHRESLHPATRKLLRRRRAWRRFRPLSTRLSGASRWLRAGPGHVYLGVDTSGLESYLFDRRYEQLPSYEGFGVYKKRPLGFELYPLPEVVAVGDGIVVTSVGIGGGAIRPRRQVELVVDAKRGAVARFHEQSDQHDRAVRPLAEATLGVAGVAGVDHPLGGATLYGNTWTVAPEVTTFSGALAFEDEADARVADLRAYGRSVAPGHASRSVDRSGLTATLSSEVPTGRFDAGYPGDPGADGVPDVDFAVEPLSDGDRARVVHAGGQAVAAERLAVTVGGDPAVDQFADDHDRVAEGDAVTVATPGLAVVEVTWTAPDGEASLLLARAAAR
jgi:hypothetical protein